MSERPHGSQQAGSIEHARTRENLNVPVASSPHTNYESVALRYELLLNSELAADARYATLVHELAHLYCGHLGTPNSKWWPDRSGLELAVREFEAESVCYLVCGRLGIYSPSEEYLAAYVRDYEETPPITLDCVWKAAWLIEQMGRRWLGLRREKRA